MIADAGASGGRSITYVWAGGVKLAHLRVNSFWQPGGTYSTYDAAYYEHTDASGMSFRMTKRLAPFGYGDYSDYQQGEFDAGNSNLGLSTDYVQPYSPPNDPPIPLESESMLYIDGQFVPCSLDGIRISCSTVYGMANSGSLAVNRYIGTRYVGQTIVEATPGGLYWENSATYRVWRDGGIGFTQIGSTTAWLTFGPRPGRTRTVAAPLGDKAKLEQAVNNCAQIMFGVRLVRTLWSSSSRNGIMDFLATTATVRDKRSQLGFTYPRMTRFSVFNDSTSYSSSRLGSLGRGGYGGPGLSGQFDNNLGRYVATNQTFTANDVGNPSTDPMTPNGIMRYFALFESIQIHETGNALARLTDRAHTAGNWTDPTTGINYRFGIEGPIDSRNRNVVDDDSGQAFELCAMLRYRKLTGYK